MSSLSIAIVCFQPDLPQLTQTLDSLAAAVRQARAAGVLQAAALYLVDNSPDATPDLREWLDAQTDYDDVVLLGGHGNIGFGAGHNLAISRSNAAYHLVLNPDVILAADCLAEGLRFMEKHPEAGMIAPYVANADGTQAFLCKRYPNLLDLFLRGFAPLWLRRLCRQRLARYEMRAECLAVSPPACLPVPIISGCFMLCNRARLQQLGGFDRCFFLYFEDFDLSLRMNSVAPIYYAPALKIIHFGGHAARKGIRHILLFGRSALQFFQRHGWRWV